MYFIFIWSLLYDNYFTSGGSVHEKFYFLILRNYETVHSKIVHCIIFVYNLMYINFIYNTIALSRSVIEQFSKFFSKREAEICLYEILNFVLS